MARVVVTGGGGFIGSHLCAELLARGDSVVCVDNFLTGRRDNVTPFESDPRFELIVADVSFELPVEGAVDAVMHLASPASPPEYLRLPFESMDVSSLGTRRALDLARAHDARFFLASTSEVYGDPLVHPQPESYWGNVNPNGPRSVYDEAKRFAETMTMAYRRYHGVNTAIVRIFNSILADEQVLYDDGRELRREPVGQLADRLRGQVDLDGYRVPAFDANGRISSAVTTALVGHPPTGPCYEVRTRYGRSIRVTGDHSLFIRGDDGRPVARSVCELNVGDRVAIACRIDVPVRDREVLDVVALLDSREPSSLVVRAPGLGATAWERRFELFGAMQSECDTSKSAWRSSIWSTIRGHRDRDQLPLSALRKLGVAIPDRARIRQRTSGRAHEMPASIPVSDELLWLFGLWVADGSSYEGPKGAYITISCDAATLDRAEKIIAMAFECHVVRVGAEAARGAALFAHSRLLYELFDALGFLGQSRRIPGWVLGLPLERLGWFLEGYREGDGVHSGKKFADGVRHEFSTISVDLKDDLVVAFARFGLVPSVGHDETTFRQETGERQHPSWRLTLANVSPWSPLSWANGVEQALNCAVTRDLVWASVTSIVEIEPTSLVYDFCVPGVENFWAGGGIMAHNTYGPMLRPADGRVVSNFLVQAMRGDPITIYGDGSQTRSFCYVEDEVRGLLALLDSDEHDPVNIGNPDEFTIAELAKIVIDVTDSTSALVYEELPADDPTRRRPDITRAKTLLGWSPTIDLREGLRRTYGWYQQEAACGRL